MQWDWILAKVCYLLFLILDDFKVRIVKSIGHSSLQYRGTKGIANWLCCLLLLFVIVGTTFEKKKLNATAAKHWDSLPARFCENLKRNC